MRRRPNLLLLHLLFPSATQLQRSHLRRRFPNGSSGSYGSTHTGAPRFCRLVAFLILLPVLFTRKLFTFVFTLNMAGIGLAASGHFPYAMKWTSAMALGNLNFAILMRNELFGRLLYLLMNTCFAKVTITMFYLGPSAHHLSVGALVVEAWLYVCSSGTFTRSPECEPRSHGVLASRRHS